MLTTCSKEKKRSNTIFGAAIGLHNYMKLNSLLEQLLNIQLNITSNTNTMFHIPN